MNEHQLKAFVRELVAKAFAGYTLDGHDVLELALRHSVLKAVKYDPAKHGPAEGTKPGEDWYVYHEYMERASRRTEER